MISTYVSHTFHHPHFYYISLLRLALHVGSFLNRTVAPSQCILLTMT